MMEWHRVVGLPGGDAAEQRRLYFLMKRLLDVLLALAVLVFAAPVMLVIALLIKLDSPGPILFRQTRVGHHGREFTFYKFRSMYHNVSSEMHQRYIEAFMQNRPAEQEGQGAQTPVFKLQRDPRITQIGRFLRRTSLDELPQILNVLRGDMSWVGPRPPLPYEVAKYQDWHRGRLATLPGITGWWQVRGRSRVPFDEMVRMDLEYISRQSLVFDLMILVLTLPAVLSGSGAE